jgi:hypothetical protein
MSDDVLLRDLPDAALQHLASEFGAVAALGSRFTASGWGAWMWWLTNRERERRRGNHDVGLPPTIVDVPDLRTAELQALRDVFGEASLMADLHGEDAFTGWCRKLVGRFEKELDRREQAKADLQAWIDERRRERPHGSVRGDTSRIPL